MSSVVITNSDLIHNKYIRRDRKVAKCMIIVRQRESINHYVFKC